MAYNPETESYDEYPHSAFPGKICDAPNMVDLSPTLRPIAEQYKAADMINDTDTMSRLLNTYPDLKRSLFNAEKHNVALDEIKALQTYYKDDVQGMIRQIAQNTVGINDSPADAQKELTTYSSEKIDTLLDQTNRAVDRSKEAVTQVRSLSLSAGGWSAAVPYTQTVSLSGITSADAPVISISIPASATPAEVKAQNKSYGYIDRAVTNDGSITFYCYNKKPIVNFSVNVKGV